MQENPFSTQRTITGHLRLAGKLEHTWGSRMSSGTHVMSSFKPPNPDAFSRVAPWEQMGFWIIDKIRTDAGLEVRLIDILTCTAKRVDTFVSARVCSLVLFRFGFGIPWKRWDSYVLLPFAFCLLKLNHVHKNYFHTQENLPSFHCVCLRYNLSRCIRWH